GDKFFFPVSGFLMARRLSHSNNYGIAHAYQASYGAGAAWLLKLFNPRLKFILTLQEGKNLDRQGFWINFFRKMIIKKADLITAISNYLKDYARKFNKKTKIAVIPNGVDIENFSRDFSYGELSSVADGLGVKPGEKVIISVSRLVPKNGIDILIRAFFEVYKLKTENYKLVLVGDGSEKESLKLQVESLKLQNNVIFAGSVSHAELPKYLKISDVFVRPSRSEGLGSAFLEAMAAGLPVIGTKVGGIPDFLKNKETGLFAEVDNPEDLAEKINLVLNDKDLAEKLKKNARGLVAEKYNWDIIARQFGEIYES
ncbi:MAG: glycosyltransferase family 4 protein, partial [Candidatus Azambacteria bacterium]|nr:glycosyltransferase family 4 protein [Candidatus Azambacteria bacterium]